MTDSLMFDFATDDTEAGFRLHRIEVYNWGTFDGRITTLQLDGMNTLVTGENGSGKSTFIDALTTLLVRSDLVKYNRAAGVDKAERDLRSYVQGHYRSEYNEHTGASKPVALRPGKSTYTVILGFFRNTGFDSEVTVAQVFWPAEQGQPNRRFVIAERELTIAEHFRGFTKGVRELTSQLKASGAEVHDQFAAYGARMRRLLGIQSEQAMELFHQTVSMKAVGNLTEFVRAHMLDTKPVRSRLDSLVTHFEDLTRAHASVMRAKRQVELLAPIVSDGERHATETLLREELEQCRRELRPYFGRCKITLLGELLSQLALDRTKAEQRLERVKADRQRSQQRIDQLTADIAGSGGDELTRLAAQIEERSSERDRRRTVSQAFAASASVAGVTVPASDADFVDMTEAVRARRSTLEAERNAHSDRQANLAVELKELRVKHAELNAEIENLRSQRGNIPLAQIALRDEISKQLSIDLTELPFAGELMRVADDEERWEGAAERLLHNLALSLLVPEAHYPVIQRWVDEHHLRGRLVYFRIHARSRAREDDIHRYALLHKIEVREGLAPSIDAWLRSELANRANVACCEAPEQFIREPRAITLAGQIKGSNQRHEKDDRHSIADRSRYVLGWSSASKVAALANQVRPIELRIHEVADEHTRTQQAQSATHAIADALAKLEGREFRDIDWQSVAGEIAELEQARDALLGSSDRLRELETQLATVRIEHTQISDAVEKASQTVGGVNDRIVETGDERDELMMEFGVRENRLCDGQNPGQNHGQSDLQTLTQTSSPENRGKAGQKVELPNEAVNRFAPTRSHA
jgi:uncharacterized protein YPO0396